MATILSVGYSLAGVGPDAVGGAEQVLRALDAALVRKGHHSIVIAPEGSRVQGTLVPLPAIRGVLDAGARMWAQRRQGEAILEALARWPVDLVHMHGLDFAAALPPPGTPVLATLHLPPAWYPPEVFRLERPATYLNCVSATQEAACPDSSILLPFIGNGVPEVVRSVPVRRRGYAVSLGRICPEKGFHLALEAATRAGSPFLLGGRVFRYPEHELYFESEIRPRLDRSRRFIGPVGWIGKSRLLGAAEAILIPSLVPETSSLVAMEALSCGTPVIALRSGALVELIEPGRTGYLVSDVAEMAEALTLVEALDRAECAAVARERFGEERMTAAYLATYERVLRGEITHAN
jgi:glycosyltransferase involved in cell wall biosynthesis